MNSIQHSTNEVNNLASLEKFNKTVKMFVQKNNDSKTFFYNMTTLYN